MQKRQKRILRVRTPLCSARNPYSCTCRLHTSASRSVHPCALCYNGLWLSGDIARTSTLYAHYKNWLRRARLHKNHLSRGVCENAPQRKRCVVEKETRFNERHGMMRCRYEKMRVCVCDYSTRLLFANCASRHKSPFMYWACANIPLQ